MSACATAPEVVATAERAERLAAMVAHELRNPLASALTNLAVAEEMTAGADPRKDFLRQAAQDLVRVRELLEACLELGRTARIAPRLVDIADLARTVATVRGVRANGSVRIVFDGPASPLHARVDPLLVERLLHNLVDNAVKALACDGRDAAGTVRIGVAPAGDGVALVVEDDGPGIPAALQDRIFAPFVTGGGGSGLGLFFVRQVVDAHDASIAVGRGHGRGARFEIRFRGRL